MYSAVLVIWKLFSGISTPAAYLPSLILTSSSHKLLGFRTTISPQAQSFEFPKSHPCWINAKYFGTTVDGRVPQGNHRQANHLHKLQSYQIVRRWPSFIAYAFRKCTLNYCRVNSQWATCIFLFGDIQYPKIKFILTGPSILGMPKVGILNRQLTTRLKVFWSAQLFVVPVPRDW